MAETGNLNTEIYISRIPDPWRDFIFGTNLPIKDLYHQKIDLDDGVQVELLDSGHILGSAMAKFTRGTKSIIFTGDLGGGNSPLLPLCENPKDLAANYLVMESVYGDRNHEPKDERDQRFREIVKDVVARKAVLVIPAFSVERTQVLLYELNEMLERSERPSSVRPPM